MDRTDHQAIAAPSTRFTLFRSGADWIIDDFGKLMDIVTE